MNPLSASSTSDWSYEKDYVLAHVGGLKVDFSDAHFSSDKGARQKALGSFVSGTVRDSRRRAQARGLTEVEAAKETKRLFSQARVLYRTRPAGTQHAPRSLKRERMRELVERRKEGPWPSYGAIGEFHDGEYECDHVSPFTKSANNLDSPVFVLLLDWATRANLNKAFDEHTAEHGYSANEATTGRLKELLHDHFRLQLDQVYATNLFPFIRDGRISSKDRQRAAREYALPQIEIVAPRLVICLGGDTFNALRQATGHKPIDKLDGRLENPFQAGECGAQVWSQAHTGFWGQRRGAERVAADWALMAGWYDGAAS